MHIYLMTDLEGVAGVVDFKNYCTPGDRYYDLAKRLLTQEVNAAADGFFEGGADAVTVLDGHGPGAIDIEILDERCRYERGIHNPIYPWGLDEGYDAMVIIGQHAKSGTPYSHITHTGSFACYDISVNGYSIGEFGELALCAMELGIPTIMVSGEEAFCREAADLTPGVVTAPVKRGLLPDDHKRGLTAEQYSNSKLSANHLAPKAACKLIREKALQAISLYFTNRSVFKYREFHAPYSIVREMRAIEAANTPRRIQKVEGYATFTEALNALNSAKFEDLKD